MSNSCYTDEYSERYSNHYSGDCDCEDNYQDCYEHFRHEGIFAQFVSQAPQNVNTPQPTCVNIPKPILRDTKCIELVPPNTILLQPGIYSVSYHVTIENRETGADTFNVKLFLNNRPLNYTQSSIRLEAPNNSNIGSVSKTNFIKVRKNSCLQLVTDESGTTNANYILTNASIVIEKVC